MQHHFVQSLSKIKLIHEHKLTGNLVNGLNPGVSDLSVRTVVFCHCLSEQRVAKVG